jgi:hypothetical protein
LPAPHNTLALKYAEKHNWCGNDKNTPCKHVATAIFHCFDWEGTKEGSAFWYAVMEHYINGTELPQINTQQ